MNVYLAGPMTGIADLNKPAFEAAQRRLQRMGHYVVTPFELNERVWTKHFGRATPLDIATLADLHYGDPLLNEMLVEDVNFIAMHADAVALLPGWESSRGSKLEIHIANLMGKTLLDARTAQPIQVVTAIEATRSPGAIQLELGI